MLELSRALRGAVVLRTAVFHSRFFGKQRRDQSASCLPTISGSLRGLLEGPAEDHQRSSSQRRPCGSGHPRPAQLLIAGNMGYGGYGKGYQGHEGKGDSGHDGGYPRGGGDSWAMGAYYREKGKREALEREKEKRDSKARRIEEKTELAKTVGDAFTNALRDSGLTSLMGVNSSTDDGGDMKSFGLEVAGSPSKAKTLEKKIDAVLSLSEKKKEKE